MTDPVHRGHQSSHTGITQKCEEAIILETDSCSHTCDSVFVVVDNFSEPHPKTVFTIKRITTTLKSFQVFIDYIAVSLPIFKMPLKVA